MIDIIKYIPKIQELIDAIEHLFTVAQADGPQLSDLADAFGNSKKHWAKAATRIRRELLRGRKPRKCSHRVCKKRGKLQVFVVPELIDKVINRVAERRSREVLTPHLPAEHVGLLAKTSLQKASQGIANHVRDHHHDHVLVGDAAACHESLQPTSAIDQFESWGADPWTIQWLRRFYKRNKKNVKGIGRGLSFSPVLAAAALLRVYARLRPWAKHVVWTGDDFLAFVDPANATNAANEFEAGLKDVGLHSNVKKNYLGPITGNWSFGGYVFEDGIAAPKPAAIERLTLKLDEALPADPVKAGRVVDGWCAQYVPTISSPAVAAASNDIKDKHGKGFGLHAGISKIAARTRPWDVSLPGITAGSKSASKVESPQTRSYSLSPCFSQSNGSPLNKIAAIAAARPPSRGADLVSGSSPETLLDPARRDPDILHLRWEPERFPVLARGGLMQLAGASGHDLMRIAEALEENLQHGRFRGIGYRDANTFIEQHLGQTMDEARHLIAVARCADQFAWGEPDEDIDPPIGLLKATLHVRSRKRWAEHHRRALLSLVVEGVVSIRAVKEAVRRSLRAARRVVRQWSRKERRRRKLKASLWIRQKDGRIFILRGGEGETLRIP